MEMGNRLRESILLVSSGCQGPVHATEGPRAWAGMADTNEQLKLRPMDLRAGGEVLLHLAGQEGQRAYCAFCEVMIVV